MLASTLIGVLGQRLVRNLCPVCKTPIADGAEECRPVGCSACGGAGFKGRSAIGEIITITDTTRPRIRHGVSADELASTFRKEGYRTIYEDGMAKVARGIAVRADVAQASRA